MASNFERGARPAIKPPLDAPAKDDAPIGAPTFPAETVNDAVNRKLDAVLTALTALGKRQTAVEARFTEQQPSNNKKARPQARARATVVAIGRDGERLSRRHDETTNPFELPPEFVEMTKMEGYDLEWKAESVTGQDRITYMAKMMANGWRPVSNSRLPGVYAQEGDEGPVRFEGQVLMERPLQLTEEAREEEARKAYDQVRMKHESWGVETKDPSLYHTNSPMAKSFNIKPHSTVEPSDPNWQPSLEIGE